MVSGRTWPPWDNSPGVQSSRDVTWPGPYHVPCVQLEVLGPFGVQHTPALIWGVHSPLGFPFARSSRWLVIHSEYLTINI